MCRMIFISIMLYDFPCIIFPVVKSSRVAISNNLQWEDYFRILTCYLLIRIHNYNDSRFTLLASNSLRIDDVGRDDKGIYQCLVSDSRGSVQASGELKLGGNNK